MFRGVHREEYLCIQMIKLHLLSRIPTETLSFWIQKHPIVQYPMTKYEADLFNYINIFHSNGVLSKNSKNQLDYSNFQSIYLTSYQSFNHLHQIIYANPHLSYSNQLPILPHSSIDQVEIVAGNLF